MRPIGTPIRLGSVVVETVLHEKVNVGYNAATERYEDMMKAGIIDPTKVVRTALQNAASVAGLLITTECMITDIKEKENGAHMGGGGMPPGMGGDF